MGHHANDLVVGGGDRSVRVVVVQRRCDTEGAKVDDLRAMLPPPATSCGTGMEGLVVAVGDAVDMFPSTSPRKSVRSLRTGVGDKKQATYQLVRVTPGSRPRIIT